jgi:hypothetical protein
MSKPASIPKVDYAFNPIYHDISTRFRTRHGIDIGEYIESMSWLGRRVEQGFSFVPRDAANLTTALGRAGFQNDLREKHLGFIPSVGALAALATHGQGYREKGSPSLHCAIAPDICNVHLDNVGFRMDGYGPDAGQHIVDELLWQDKIVPAVGKLLPTQVTDLLHRFHPVIPNTRQIKPFSELGFEFDVASGRSRDLQRQWRVTIDVTHSCSDVTCDVWRKLDGKSVEGDNKATVMFKVVGM